MMNYAPSLKAKAAALLELRRRQRLQQLESSAYVPFTDFKRNVYHRYQHAPHLEALDSKLAQVAEYVVSGGKRGIGRLIVEMPPRHGKSTTVARLFPAWLLGAHPDFRVMVVTYAVSLARKHSRYTRNLIRTAKYQDTYPGITLADDSASAEAWDIAGREGGMDALGMLGGATGKGAHCLIIDDPLKNRQEAESALIRDRIWDGFTDDLLTRLEPGGAVILNATRWHQDDLIGRAMRLMPGEWTRLRLPAIAEDVDELGRQPGDALWPARYPIEKLREFEAALGPYSWSSLYQQNPVPSEGGIFKRANLPAVDVIPQIVSKARFWDLAMSSKTQADYSVGVMIGEGTDGAFYVLDVTRKQIDWGDVVTWMANTMLADGPNVLQGIEQQGYMSRAIQDLNRDGRLHNHTILGYPKDTDKLTNALPLSAKAAAGMLKVARAHWTEPFIEELCAFPQGAHDDQVDAASGAYHMLASGGTFGGAMAMAQYTTFIEAV